MPVTIHHDKHKEAQEFLKSHKVGVLATVDPDGNPHAAAVYYSVDNKLEVSFLTRVRTRKADNLRHNNHAMLVVYDAATQTTVQLTGVVEEVTGLEEQNEVFTNVIYASLETSHLTVPPVSKLDEGEYVTYRLKSKQVRMAVFSQPQAGGYKDLFKTIQP